MMQQALIVEPTRFEVVHAPVPQLREPGEILLRTAACGICSGDLMPWYLEKKVSTVLGHEVVGWAVEVGASVEHIRPGDLVFVHHHAPCTKCEECRRGHPVHCVAWRNSRLDPGGMAEYIRVPAEIVSHDCFAVNDLGAERALFIEPLACCYKALSRWPVGPAAAMFPGCKEYRANTSAVIVGCGVMGLLNLALARAMGCGRVIAVEPDEDRSRWARVFGADEILTPAEAEKRLSSSADVVIIGPGQPQVIQQALRYVRPGGTALLFTPTPARVVTELDLGDLYFREVSLVPSYSCGPDDTRRAVDYLRQGAVKPERMITHRFPLEDVQRAYDTARQGGPALKVVIVFPQE
jgi:L-iditol 2-dehydrogenase